MSNSKYYDGMTSGVVELGEIRGYKWEIRVNRGNHPCAYVTIPNEHFIVESEVRDYYEVERECKIDVHGGLTYMHGNEIGWDYAHAGDFTYYSPRPNDHKWTHEEIMEDIYRAIEALEQADKPYQEKRKVEGLLREIGNIYIEHIERAENDSSISIDYDSDNSVRYYWFGGHCKLDSEGIVKITADFKFQSTRGKELYKRDVKNAIKRDIEWYKKRLNELEKQLEQQ
jgi:hypothetical protein